MASIKKISAAELSKARRAGFKRKKPKKPKTSAPLSSWEAYVDRYNRWVDDARSKVKEKASKESAKSKKKKLIEQIRKSC